MVAANKGNISNDIYIDGGCNYHSFKDRRYLIEEPTPVANIWAKSATSNDTIYAKGVGSVSLVAYKLMEASRISKSYKLLTGSRKLTAVYCHKED